MVRMALLSRTVVTVGHVCWPRSPRACAGGSWGGPPRRAVPSGATGGKQGAGLGPRRAARTRSAARAPTRLGRSRPPRSPRGASPARSRTGWAPPPARRVPCRTTSRPWIPGGAVRWPLPNRRPCTTGSAAVFRETTIHSSRASGVGHGPFWSGVYRRAVRGGPSSRQADIGTWKAVSTGGTHGRNSSSVRLVQSSTSVGRVWRSANRHVPIAVASCRWRPRISSIEMSSNT